MQPNSGVGGAAGQLYVWTVLAVAFAVELGALAAFGYAGWRSGGSTAARLALAAALPAAGALVWGLFAAPRAAVPLPGAAVVAVKIAFFAAAVLVIAYAGHGRLAAGFAAVLVVSSILAALPPVRGAQTVTSSARSASSAAPPAGSPALAGDPMRADLG